jgi:hypothetical protein
VCGVSPALRLSAELAAEIFLLSMEEETRLLARLLLCHVCSHWRAVAFSTPRLWTELHIRFIRNAKTDDLVNLAQAWLFRAAPFPVNISIIASRKITRNSPFVADIIIPFRDRIKALSLQLTNGHFASLTSLAPGQDYMPLLEELDIVVIKSTHAEDTYRALVDSISFYGSRLHRFQLPRRLETRIGNSEMFKIHWAGLTSIHLENLPPFVCQIMQLCVKLHEADIVFTRAFSWNELNTVPSRICLYNLRRLSLSCKSEDGTDRFFRHFALLAIRHFHIEGPSAGPQYLRPPDIFTTLTTLYQAAPFMLKRFHLVQWRSSPSHHFLSLLELVPSLTYLHLSESTNFELGLSYALTHHPYQTPIVPNLRRLYVKDFSYRRAEHSAIIDMIASRWWEDPNMQGPVARWKNIRIIRVADPENPFFVEDDPSCSHHRASKLLDQGLKFDYECVPLERWHEL